MFSQDIIDLQDDGFDWSNDELCISQEVFYGNVPVDGGKTCAATGVTSFEMEQYKMDDISPCSNSENSAITDQASSKDLCQKDAGCVDLLRDSQAMSSMEVSTTDEMIGPVVQAERKNLSVKELSNFKPYLDKAVASSLPLRQVVSGIYHPASHPACQVLMCHVVESSRDGLTSSCYLLNQYPESDREGNLGDSSAPNGSLSGSDASEAKQVGGFKSIASPISQESSASKLLVPSLSTAAVSQPGSLCFAGRRPDRAVTPKRENSSGLLTSNGVKDFSALIRSKAFELLKRAGWFPEKHKRSDGRNRYLYLSPDGTLFRELSIVWRLVGYNLFVHGNSEMIVDGKQWTSIDQFYSDLCDTFRYIENKTNDLEPRCALACQWRLLDPFVNVVLVNRKIHALRAGHLVKATQSNLFDLDFNAEVRLGSKKAGRKWIVNRNREKTVCESSLASDTFETHKTRSIYVSEGGSMRLVKAIDKDGNYNAQTCTDENMYVTSSHLSACNSDNACRDCSMDHVENGETSSKSPISLLEHRRGLKRSRFSKSHPSRYQNGCCQEELTSGINSDACKKGRRPKKHGKKRSRDCQLKDDDLLISAIIKKKSFRSGMNKRSPEPRKYKSKSLKKRKTQKGSCRLLPRGLGKGSKHFSDRWTLMGKRTVLSWLISTGALFINEAIQFRDPKDDAVVKDGLITRDGIICKCCSELHSVSEFKIHSGFNQNRPCLNLFMGSGRPFTLCQLQAWSTEYKVRRSSMQSVAVDEFDKNDDSCGICGDGGELLCCDNCPSTFHQSCLSAEELPEGSWYCKNCTCEICGHLANDKETSSSYVSVKCLQCEKKYHEVCLSEKGMCKDGAAPWLCGIRCEEVYGGLQSRIGLSNQIGDGYSWTLLRCIHDDQKISSAQRFALKAECNSKLAVAVTIMEECFLSMIDPRTGIDMIPQVVYNWGSEFARLDYHGFYTAVLEKDDILISVASIRLHGIAVAEMPLIATCSKYRRQGMCRRLLSSVEKMLMSLKVEKLVIAAISDLVETWTIGFGFVRMEEDEKRSLRKLNLMVFPGTVMLKKMLYIDEASETEKGLPDGIGLGKDESSKIGVRSDGVREAMEGDSEDNSMKEVAGEVQVKVISSADMKAVETQKSNEVGAGMVSGLLKCFSLSESQEGQIVVKESEQAEHSNMAVEEISQAGESIHFKLGSARASVDDDSVGLQVSSLGSEFKLFSDLSPFVEEHPYKCLQVAGDQEIAEAAEHIELTSFQDDVNGSAELVMRNKPRNHLTTKLENSEALKRREEAEGMVVPSSSVCGNLRSDLVNSEVKEAEQLAEGMYIGDACNISEDVTPKSSMKEEVTKHEEVAEDTEVETTSYNSEYVTTDLVKVEAVKEDEEATEGMTSRNESIGHSERLDGVASLQKHSPEKFCEYHVPIVVTEVVSKDKTQCVNVTENQLSLIEQSQEVNVLPQS